MKIKLRKSKEITLSPTEWPTQKKKETFQAWWTIFYLLCKIQKDTEIWNDGEFFYVEKFYCSAMNSYDFFLKSLQQQADSFMTNYFSYLTKQIIDVLLP